MNTRTHAAKATAFGFGSLFNIFPSSDVPPPLARDRRVQDRNRLNGDFQKVVAPFSTKVRNEWAKHDKQK
jgi:hypothetical protein